MLRGRIPTIGSANSAFTDLPPVLGIEVPGHFCVVSAIKPLDGGNVNRDALFVLLVFRVTAQPI